MSHAVAAPAANDAPMLDPHRLDCYRVALELATLAARLIPRGHREQHNQRSRASRSIPLNVAESCGRRSPADKAHFFAIARGSAMECAAIIDMARSLGIVSIAVAKEASWLIVRIAQMLTRLETSVRRL